MTEPTKTDTAVATPDAAVTTTTIKPGYKTSELAFLVIANILSACFAVDLFPTGSLAAKIAIIAALTLSSFGYTVVRTSLKKGAGVLLLLLAFGLTSSQVGCTETRDRATVGAKAFVECGKAEVKALADELVPMAVKTVMDAVRGDGKIDRPTLSSIASPLKSAATRCALDAAIATVMNPPVPKADAPQSEPFLVDRADLAAAYNEIRATAWGGVEIRSASSP